MVGMKDSLLKNLRVALPAFLLFYFFMVVGDLVDLYRKNELLVYFKDDRELFADFNAFYNAGLLCRNYFENHVSFYDLNVQMASLAKVIAPYKSNVPILSVNPPHYFLLCEPLSYVTPAHAWLIWTAISVMFLAGGIYLLDIKRHFTGYEQVCCVIGSVCCSPAYSALKMGQNSFALLFGVAVFLRLMQARKYFLAGFSMILCTFKPQYLPVLITTGLIVGRLRFAAGALLSAVIIYVTSVSAFGSGIFQSWWDFVSIKQSHTDFAVYMQTIRGEITLLTSGRDDAVGFTGSAVILGCALLFTVWLWYSFRKRLHETFIFRTLAALTVSVMLFTSPHTQNNDYVLFCITCIWILQSIKEMIGSDRLKSFLRVTIYSYPFLSWPFYLLAFIFMFARVQPLFAVNLIVFVLSLVLLLAEPRSISDTSASA
jgi:hypothetical protein